MTSYALSVCGHISHGADEDTPKTLPTHATTHPTTTHHHPTITSPTTMNSGPMSWVFF